MNTDDFDDDKESCIAELKLHLSLNEEATFFLRNHHDFTLRQCEGYKIGQVRYLKGKDPMKARYKDHQDRMGDFAS